MKTVHFWIIGIIFAFIAGGLFIGKTTIGSLLPFAIVLLCPAMMLFMMKDHDKHK